MRMRVRFEGGSVQLSEVERAIVSVIVTEHFDRIVCEHALRGAVTAFAVTKEAADMVPSIEDVEDFAVGTQGWALAKFPGFGVVVSLDG